MTHAKYMQLLEIISKLFQQFNNSTADFKKPVFRWFQTVTFFCVEITITTTSLTMTVNGAIRKISDVIDARSRATKPTLNCPQ